MRKILGLCIIQTGCGLVEQEQFRAERQGPDQLEQSLLTEWQFTNGARTKFRKPHEIKALHGLVAGAGLFGRRTGQPQDASQDFGPRMAIRPEDDIFEHRLFAKKPDVLKGPSETAPSDQVGIEASDDAAVERYPASGRPEHRGDQVERRRFSGAVRPDNAMNCPCANGKRQIRQRY